MRAEEEEAERVYREAAARSVGVANQFLAELEPASEVGLARLPEPLETETGFRVKSGFRFKRFESRFVSALWVQWLVDSLSPAGWLRGRAGGADALTRGAGAP